MIHGRPPWVSFLKTAARLTRCGTHANLPVLSVQTWKHRELPGMSCRQADHGTHEEVVAVSTRGQLVS